MLQDESMASYRCRYAGCCTDLATMSWIRSDIRYSPKPIGASHCVEIVELVYALHCFVIKCYSRTMVANCRVNNAEGFCANENVV